MTTDIIIIYKDTFLENKIDIESNNYKKIWNKYDELFNKYSCFSTTFVFTQKFLKENYKKKSRIIINKNKNIKNVILGILNIINSSNYDKMFNKIKFLKSENNLIIIIDEILNICSFQQFYIKIYIKLILDLINISTEIEKNIINNTIIKFYNNFITQKEWLNTQIASALEYNDFCDDQKLKIKILSKNNVILELYNNLQIFDINIYINNIINDLFTYKSILLSQILLDIFKFNNNIHVFCNEIVSVSYFNKLLSINNNKKFQFIIEDIINILAK